MKKLLPLFIPLIVFFLQFNSNVFAGNYVNSLNKSLHNKNSTDINLLIPVQTQLDNLLRVQFVGGAGADEFVLYFDPTAQNGFDVAFDSEKYMADGAGIPNIYTYADTFKVSINAMQTMGNGLIVPVGIRTKVAGNYHINVIDISTFAPTVGIYLEDVVTGTTLNLRNTSQYTVNLPVGVFNQRFKLHLYPSLNVAVSNETCLQSDGRITITNPSSQSWNYNLLNSNGALLASSSLPNTSFSNLDDGNYRLRMDNGNGYLVEELINIPSAEPVIGNIMPMSSNTFYTTDVIEAAVEQPDDDIEYSWFLNDLLAGTGKVVSLNITSPGLYSLKLRLNASNCEFETSKEFSVLQAATVGIETNESASGFIIYPNPARDFLNIQVNRKMGFTQLTVFDASGRLVYNEKLNTAQGQQALQLPLGDLNPGIYQIILEGSNSRSTAKFTKLR